MISVTFGWGVLIGKFGPNPQTVEESCNVTYRTANGGTPDKLDK